MWKVDIQSYKDHHHTKITGIRFNQDQSKFNFFRNPTFPFTLNGPNNAEQ